VEESRAAAEARPVEAATEVEQVSEAPAEAAVEAAPESLQPEPPVLEPLHEDEDETPSSPLDEPFVRDDRDASAVSIWDVFGIPRPSVGQAQAPGIAGPMKTLAELPAGPPLINPLAPKGQTGYRLGLRAVLRRRLVRLRHR
jgi:hypothetical protein